MVIKKGSGVKSIDTRGPGTPLLLGKSRRSASPASLASRLTQKFGILVTAAAAMVASPEQAEAGSGPAPEFVVGNFAPNAVVRNAGKSYVYGFTRNGAAGGVVDAVVSVFDTPGASPSVHTLSGLDMIGGKGSLAVSPSGRKICVYSTDNALTSCGDLDGSGKNVSNLEVLPNPSSSSIPKSSMTTGGGLAFVGEDHLAANNPVNEQLILIPILDQWSTTTSSVLSLSSCSTVSGVNNSAGSPIGGKFYLNSNAAGSSDLYFLTYDSTNKRCFGSPQSFNTDPNYGVLNTAQDELGGAVDSNGDAYFGRYNTSTSTTDLYVARKAGTVLPDAGVDAAVPDAGTDSGVDAAPNLDGGVDAPVAVTSKVDITEGKDSCDVIDLDANGVGAIQVKVNGKCKAAVTIAGANVPLLLDLENHAQVVTKHDMQIVPVSIGRSWYKIPDGVRETVNTNHNPSFIVFEGGRFGSGAGGVLGNEGSIGRFDTTIGDAKVFEMISGKKCFSNSVDNYNVTDRFLPFNKETARGCVSDGAKVVFSYNPAEGFKIKDYTPSVVTNPDGGVNVPDATVANVPNNPVDKGGCSSAPEGYTDFSGSGFLGLAAAMIAARLVRKRKVK